MLIYATKLELARWLNGPDATEDQAPANADALLRSASILIRKATRRAMYRVSSDGLPQDATKRQAFNEAALAQAGTLSKLGLDPSAGGVASLKAAVASKGMGSLSVSYVQGDATEAARQALASGEVLTFEAYELLSEAGLVSSAVGGGYGITNVITSDAAYINGQTVDGGLIP